MRAFKAAHAMSFIDGIACVSGPCGVMNNKLNYYGPFLSSLTYWLRLGVDLCLLFINGKKT